MLDRPHAVAALFVLMCGCVQGSGGRAADGGMEAGAPDAGVPPPDGSAPTTCSPALAIDPPGPSVLPLGLIGFRASGGTGQYRFSLRATDGGSGSSAILNELSGAYLAGDAFGVTDEVTVVDLGCEGSAVASIEVVPPMDVRPLFVELLPTTSFTYQIVGGSGAFSCSLEVDGSGATVTPDCTFTAGAAEGVDVVEVSDPGTGQTVDSTVTVRLSASLLPAPARFFIPLGSSYVLSVIGGSGWFDADISGTAVSFLDGVVTGEDVGTSTLDLTDQFTGMTTTVTAGVVPPQETDFPRAGDQSVWAVALAPGDVDGDGYADALVDCWPNVATHKPGCLAQFRGGPAGIVESRAVTTCGGIHDNSPYYIY